MSEKTWTTQDKRKISVTEMATPHIRNALAMMQRKGFIGVRKLLFYLTCPLPNGDAARDCFTMERDRAFDSPVSRFIDIFEEELNKRAIKKENEK